MKWGDMSKLLNLLALLILGGLVGVVGWWTNEYRDSLMEHERGIAERELRIAGLNESPSDLLEEPREEEEMTYRELGRLARMIEQSGGQANKLLVKRGQKISLPVATLIIPLRD